MMNQTLLALSISRRTFAGAFFVGTQLDNIEVRRALADEDKALATSLGFLAWLLDHFHVRSAAVEIPDSHKDSRRDRITAAVLQALNKEGISVWKVSRNELLASLADPGLRRRGSIREIAASFWPVLNDGSRANAKLDA